MPSTKFDSTKLTLEESERDLVFKALADYNRRMILQAVYDEPNINLTDLCTYFPLSRFGIMKHINVLIAAKLLSVEADGKFKRYKVNVAPITSTITPWLSSLKQKDA